jgi:hypothetical protein
MRSRLFLLASSLAVLGATPCLALTISSAPPSRDVAPHLSQSGTSGASPRENWGGGRPQAGASFSSGTTTTTYGTSSYGFGPVRTTVLPAPRNAWQSERRETPAPMSLSPPRR